MYVFWCIFTRALKHGYTENLNTWGEDREGQGKEQVGICTLEKLPIAVLQLAPQCGL